MKLLQSRSLAKNVQFSWKPDYNMLQFLEGDKMGPTAYYVDVRAKPAGWNIFLKRGATIESPTVLHTTKGIRLLWDKGTPVRIEVSLTINHKIHPT